MLLAVLALALGLIAGSVPAASQLPATWPGASADEGVFLVTSADTGKEAIFFIAQNQRHSITASDMQQELQLNPLRPVRSAPQLDVLRFVEGSPVGSAAVGLLQSTPAPVAETLEAPAPAEDSVYVLQPGDNLIRISARFGVDQNTLMAANGITNPNRIYIGQILVIPGADTAPTGVAEAPAEATVAADESLVAADESTYVVQAGDSAFKISTKFGIDQNALLAANGITNPNRVYAGQTLVIPSAT